MEHPTETFKQIMEICSQIKIDFIDSGKFKELDVSEWPEDEMANWHAVHKILNICECAIANEASKHYLDIPLGITREELKDRLGEPNDLGGTSRKYKTPCVYKYNGVQFFFGPRANDTLVMIGFDDESGNFHKMKD
jgi:hypothetical protein